MNKSLLYLVCLFIFTLCANANTHNKILWNTVSYAPSLISEGPYKNQGFSDMSRELFIFNLEEYEHEILAGSIQKAMQDLESNENYCFTGLTRDKFKEEFIQYSKPFLEILPNELVIRNEDKKRFKSYIGLKTGVNLHRLLQNNGFVFGYVKHREYTSYINRLILLNEDKKHLFSKKISSQSVGLLELLAQEKFDYMIEYPTVLSYVTKKKNINVEFSSYPIMSSNDLVKLYVGCSKNEFGKNVIKKIDKLIDTNHEMFEAFYKSWLDYNSKKKYEEYIMNNK